MGVGLAVFDEEGGDTEPLARQTSQQLGAAAAVAGTWQQRRPKLLQPLSAVSAAQAMGAASAPRPSLAPPEAEQQRKRVQCQQQTVMRNSQQQQTAMKNCLLPALTLVTAVCLSMPL
jgi:hypothetical protein